MDGPSTIPTLSQPTSIDLFLVSPPLLVTRRCDEAPVAADMQHRIATLDHSPISTIPQLLSFFLFVTQPLSQIRPVRDSLSLPLHAAQSRTVSTPKLSRIRSHPLTLVSISVGTFPLVSFVVSRRPYVPLRGPLRVMLCATLRAYTPYLRKPHLHSHMCSQCRARPRDSWTMHSRP